MATAKMKPADKKVFDNVIAPQHKLIEAVGKRPYPCVLVNKGKKYGLFLPHTKKAQIKDKDVKAVASALGATGAQMIEGQCSTGQGGFVFTLKCPEKTTPDKLGLAEGEMRKSLNEFMNFDGSRKNPFFKKMSFDIVETLPELEEDEGTEPEEASATPPPRAPEPPPETPSSDTGTVSIEELTTRFKGMQDQLKRVIASNPDRGEALNKAATGVVGLLKGGDSKAAVAAQAMDKLADALSRLDTAAPGVNRDAVKRAQSAWMEASDEVDEQITALQRKLREQDDEELHEIAEFGLNALTGNFKVPLMAALRDLDSANDDSLPGAAKKARDIVVKFKAHVASSPQIAACDDNPWSSDCKVTIVSTLGGALDEMDKALAG